MILPDDENDINVEDIATKKGILFVDLIERVGRPTHLEHESDSVADCIDLPSGEWEAFRQEV